MYENLLKAVDESLREKEFTIDYLRKDNDKLSKENKALKDRISELEREVKVFSGMSKAVSE